MKKILFALGAAALLLGSCIKDKGNYDYTVPDAPRVTLDESYTSKLGENLVVKPTIEWGGDLSRAVMRYTFTYAIDRAPVAVAANADGSFDAAVPLTPGTYPAQLEIRVPDNTGINADPENPGMVYYYPFTAVLGQTNFSSGTMVLVDDGGQAKMHFIDPAGGITEDVYNLVNGEPLPGTPLRMLFPIGGGSGAQPGWIVFTENGGNLDGAILKTNELTKVRTMAENFTVVPASMANPGNFIEATGFMGAFVTLGKFMLTMDGRLYSCSTTTIGADPNPPGYFMIGPKFAGDYNVTALANLSYDMGGQRTIMGWDDKGKKLLFYSIGMQPEAESTTPPVLDMSHMTPGGWNPAGAGADIELITMQTSDTGGCLIVKDGAGDFYQLTFTINMGGIMGLKKTAIGFGDLLKPDTKWTSNRQTGELIFNSGNKLYIYQPSTMGAVAPEPLVAELSEAPSLLRFRQRMGAAAFPEIYTPQTDYKTLMVGTTGHLMEVDLNGAAGSRGTIAKDTAINGTVVDVYRRSFTF